jgi:DNA-binding NarL/FixJ family response regulator
MAELPPPYRIFLIDNHTILRQSLRYLLERSPQIEFVGDADGATAYTRVLQLRPAIILLNLLLPRFDDGLKLLTALRGQLPETRVIVLTTDTDQPNAVYVALQNGAFGCLLSSSSDIAEIEQTIKQVAQGMVYVSSAALRSLVDSIAHGESAVGGEGQSGKASELTPRELEVVDLVAAGHTNREIADRLVVAESTVRSHLHNILDKLDFSNRVQIAAYAVQTHAKTSAAATRLH